MKFQATKRAGAIALWVILALPVLGCFIGVALLAAAGNAIGFQATHTTDASALAAARTLVSDELLRGRIYNNIAGINDPPTPTLLTRATDNAIRFGEYNYVNKQKITFVANPTNAASGDIVFGFIDHFAYQAAVIPADLTPGPTYVDNVKGINAVQVVMRKVNADGITIFGPLKINLVQGATAILDGDVVGFRPLFDTQFLPIIPFGITSTAWTGPIGTGTPDNFTYDTTTNTFVAGPDGLPEITVRIVADPSPSVIIIGDADTFPLTIGTVSAAGITNQVTAGVSKTEYDNFVTGYGLFELTGGPSATLSIPATKYYDNAEHANLLAAFQGLVPNGTTSLGLPRVWPLVTGAPSGAPTMATATNFVAARVVSANAGMATASDGMNSTSVNAIDIVLQPTMLESPTTVTDFARRSNVSGPNPYIAKVRLTK